MKTKATLRIALSSVLLFSLFLVMCGKSDDGPNDEPQENKTTPPDPALPYIILNVGKSDQLGNLIFPTPEDFEYRTYPLTSGSLDVSSRGGDTTRCFWLFSPSRDIKNQSFPLWRFCDADYQLQGKDEYAIDFYWSSAANGANLQQGKTYNLNMFQNSLINTRGLVSYTHKKNNDLIKHMTTFDYALVKSWIKIESISEGKASGSFVLAFTCAYAGGSGGSGTEVTGRFNKIPII
ncbi:hypothetical protein WG906_04410 [Pedobacter sp. P351]|uniref:hypothetical protein n=1 Tax=Pedobacter superstes TaxID=3133441 RepID=UPI0030A8E374